MNEIKTEMVNHDTQKLIDQLRQQKSDLDFYKSEKQKLTGSIRQAELELTNIAEKLIKDMGEYHFCFCGYGSKDRKIVLRHTVKNHGVTE